MLSNRILRSFIFVFLIISAAGVMEYYDAEIGVGVLVFALMLQVFFTSIYGEVFYVGVRFEKEESPCAYYFLQFLQVFVLVVAVISLFLGVV